MLSPSPDIKIKFGDKLVVVGEQENVKEVGMLLGNDEKKLSSTDFFLLPWVLFWVFWQDKYSSLF